jgi:hypothetical protein
MHALHFIIPPPFAFRPLSPHLLPPRPLSAPLPPPAAVSVAAVSVAAVSAAATIAVSADIAAAFWLIVVCPRCCLSFRLPPPFLPAIAVATAAVCRRHCQCRRHRHRRPCSFRRYHCHRCLFFCRRHHCLYVSTFPTASMFQRFRRRGCRCLCFDCHCHHSSSLQVIRRQWRTVAADTMIKSDGKRGVYFR